MVIIRLTRGGAKKNPFYQVVATDSRNKRDGKFLEKLGYYNPGAKKQAIKTKLHLERIKHWESHGAQISDRVKHIIKNYSEN